MQTVIYGDVLVAVNFIINLGLLGLTRKLTGVPVKRWRRYLGALAGALCSFAIFLPVQGFWWELFLRLGCTALVIGIVYLGQPWPMLLRLSAVFFTVGFLVAGIVTGLWLVLPQNLLAVHNGIIYFHIAPLVLLGCVAVAYLFVSVFDSIFAAGHSRGGVWQAVASRHGRTVRLTLFMDTGNQLVEPFSGLPVAVVGLRGVQSLLTPSEQLYISTGFGSMPQGLRPVFYNGVGGEGLLCALRPDSLRLERAGRRVDCEGYLAVSRKELSCNGCQGILNPRLLGMGLPVREMEGVCKQ